MRLLHYLNAILWLLNALLWGAYAHSLGMAVVSLLAAGVAVGMARMWAEDWAYTVADKGATTVEEIT